MERSEVELNPWIKFDCVQSINEIEHKPMDCVRLCLLEKRSCDGVSKTRVILVPK